jgi:hypothetical protein
MHRKQEVRVSPAAGTAAGGSSKRDPGAIEAVGRRERDDGVGIGASQAKKRAAPPSGLRKSVRLKK